MKTIIKKRIILFAASLLLLILPLFAQKLPSSRLLLPTVQNLTETSALPSSQMLSPVSSLPSQNSRTVLYDWGGVDDEGIGDSGGTENSNSFNDALVADGMYLLIVLLVLYAFGHDAGRRNALRLYDENHQIFK
jgi:hypothetical protein